MDRLEELELYLAKLQQQLKDGVSFYLDDPLCSKVRQEIGVIQRELTRLKEAA